MAQTDVGAYATSGLHLPIMGLADARYEGITAGPRGFVAHDTSSSEKTSVSTTTLDHAYLTIDYVSDGTRKLKITVTGYVYGSASASSARLMIRADNVLITPSIDLGWQNAYLHHPHTIIAIHDPGVSTVKYEYAGKRLSGSGTIAFGGDTYDECQMIIEDIGPQ